MEGEPLNAALDRNTRLIDMRSGRGVEAGDLRISGGGEFREFDLRNASTIGDVIDILDGAEIDGRPLVSRSATTPIRLEYTDGLSGTLAVVGRPGQSDGERPIDQQSRRHHRTPDHWRSAGTASDREYTDFRLERRCRHRFNRWHSDRAVR